MNQTVIDFSLVKTEKNISYNLSKINYIGNNIIGEKRLNITF